jgi:murein DD-endopeptidase MepM/ murein hydrolase activator NlpD
MRAAPVVLAALLPACAMLEPNARDVPRSRPVSMATLAAPAAQADRPAPAAAPAAAARTHVVARGDTLYNVGRRYGVPPAELARLNGIAAPYTIQVGQALRLPAEVPAVAAAAEVPAAIQAAALVRQAPQGVPPPEASPRGGVSAVALAPLPEPQPAAAKPAEPPVAAPLPVAKPPEPPAPPPGPAAAGPATAGPAPPGPGDAAGTTPASAPGPAPAPAAIPAPPPRSPRGFLMPVEGRIIAPFGPQPGGLSNDGINIAAPRGAPVRAADHGVVVYAGNELRGFGNMLLIRHEGGWLTAYAHLATMSVFRGAKVERGQPIGTVGMTGNVTSPQLHFEIRQGKQPVDPEKQIAAMPARTAQLGATR